MRPAEESWSAFPISLIETRSKALPVPAIQGRFKSNRGCGKNSRNSIKITEWLGA
jgi:hypothetical protein